MDKRGVCVSIYEIFPGINKYFVEKEVDIEMRGNGGVGELARQVLVERYAQMESYPKEGQIVKRHYHYKCSVCGKFVIVFINKIV
jgi:hypothetical protein